jgi:hypothetical protein
LMSASPAQNEALVLVRVQVMAGSAVCCTK